MSHCCSNLPFYGDLGDLQVVSSTESFSSRSARELCAMLRSRGERTPQISCRSEILACAVLSHHSGEMFACCFFSFPCCCLFSFLMEKKATGTFCKHQKSAAIEPRMCSYWENYAAYKGAFSNWEKQ